jgi:hypothetical protein
MMGQMPGGMQQHPMVRLPTFPQTLRPRSVVCRMRGTVLTVATVQMGQQSPTGMMPQSPVGFAGSQLQSPSQPSGNHHPPRSSWRLTTGQTHTGCRVRVRVRIAEASGQVKKKRKHKEEPSVGLKKKIKIEPVGSRSLPTIRDECTPLC